MSGEQLHSIAEVLVIARKAQRDGQTIPISPCVQPDPDGKPVTCPYVDPTLAKLCKEPEGILTGNNGTLECPKQKGPLVLNARTENRVANSAPTQEAPQTPARGSNKDRRPYFVR